MNARATKVMEPVKSEAEQIDSVLVELAQDGKAIVRESDGSYSLIATTSKVDRPRRERVLDGKTLFEAIQQIAILPRYAR